MRYRTKRRKMQKSRKRRPYGRGCTRCGGWSIREMRPKGNGVVLQRRCWDCGYVAELADAYLDQ